MAGRGQSLEYWVRELERRAALATPAETARHDYMPYLIHEGVVLGLFEAVRTSGARVLGRPTGALDSECDFTWE